MRIITGKYKGQILKMPKGIRPTQNIVRKALFDILGDIEGLSFLELFAGSGAVGFEAISRGVWQLSFVEHKVSCLQAIRKNIESLKLENCDVYPKQTAQAIKIFYEDNKKFDIIFLDPPYYLDLAKKTLQILGAYDILAPNGFIVVQHFKKDELPPKVGNLYLFKQPRYGATSLSFYRKVNPNAKIHKGD